MTISKRRIYDENGSVKGVEVHSVYYPEATVENVQSVNEVESELSGVDVASTSEPAATATTTTTTPDSYDSSYYRHVHEDDPAMGNMALVEEIHHHCASEVEDGDEDVPSRRPSNTSSSSFPITAFVPGQMSADETISETSGAATRQVVDAVHVSALHDDPEDDSSKRKRIRNLVVLGLSLFAVLSSATMFASVALLQLFRRPVQIEVEPTREPSFVFASDSPTESPTFAPTTETQRQIFETLSTLSSRVALSTEGTPQRRAMEWMLEDQYRPLDDRLFLQRYIMAVYYYATQGEQWSMGTSPFLAHDTSECKWVGITCSDEKPEEGSDEGPISEIRHGSTNLNVQGTLPPELGGLRELRSFSVGNNKISGTIPPQLAAASKLKVLSMKENNLVGPFPDSFRYHPALELLVLAGNRNFGGTFPRVFSTMSSLNLVSMKDCGLVGTLYTELGSLPLSLSRIQLSRNSLTGTLPTQFAELKKLDMLDLSNNQFTGPFPDKWVGASWPSLRILELFVNHLNGTLPNGIGANWGAGTSERGYIDLHSNDFTGTIPASLALFPQLNRLSLHDNRFTGMMPHAICALVFPDDDNDDDSNNDRKNQATVRTQIFLRNQTPTVRHNETEKRFSIETVEADCSNANDQPPEVECSCCNCCRDC